MNAKKTAAIAVAILAIAFAAPFTTEDSSAGSSITVTDGLGEEFTFDGPVNRIMTIGTGATATVIGVGCLDKIAVCDSYSKTNSDHLFDDLRTLVDQEKIRANGNLYSSGKAALQTDVTYAAGPDGTFDRNSDVVIVCGSNTYRPNIVPYLQDNGFRYVLQWNDITEYSDIIEFAKTLSKICTGEISDRVTQMEYVSNYIKDTFDTSGHAKAKAFYVTYSSSDYKVGNTGSLTNSMIVAACGNSVTVNAEKSGSTYAVGLTGLTSLIADNGTDTIIFADESISNDASKLSDMKAAVGEDVRIVALKNIWNNYSIESTEGLWTMASAMYPDLFSGDVPDIPPEKKDLKPYIIGGVAAVAIIGIGAFLFMRKH